MKTTVLISIFLLVPTLSWSQRPMQPVAPAPRPMQPVTPPQRPSPPNNQFIDGNVILPGAPLTNRANTNAAGTNHFVPTNALPAVSTNNIPPATNAISPAMARALGLTNRLSVMARAQAQAVILVQVGLNDLQVAVSSNGASSVRRLIQENPQVRQQLQTLSARIINLARGPGRPSNDSVDRLSEDLLRACSRTPLDTDGQLILSVVINLVVNCQNLSAAQVQSSVNDGAIVLRSAGVPAAVCNTLGCDLNSIALEIHPDLGI